jgi:hypothetical protein
MIKFNGFIGGSYQNATLNADAQRSMNLYVETVESGDGKSNQILLGTPGLTAFVTLPTSPVRGVWAGENRLFVVAGSKLYELDQYGSIIGLGGVSDHTARGDVGNDGAPVQIYPNGNQLMIVSAGNVWVDNGSGPAEVMFPSITGTCQVIAFGGGGTTGYQVYWNSGAHFDATMVGRTITIASTGYVISNVYSAFVIGIATPAPIGAGLAFSIPGGFIPAGTGTFLDGYYIVSVPNTKQFNFSAINNGLSWSTLDFGIKEGYPDNLAAVFADHEELYLFGTQTTEVWRNTGAALTPFERDPGAMMHIGCLAPQSVTRLSNGIAWLGGDPRGGIVAYWTQAYLPSRISTHAVETAWAGYTSVADAWAYSYEENGHFFYVVNFPTGNATWVYDLTEKSWHERGFWNGSTWIRQLQASHAFVFGKRIVGAWNSGTLYFQSLSAYDDAGTAIHRARTAPHLSDNNDRTFYRLFRLEAENSGAVNPLLAWSDDGGHTFGTQKSTTSNVAGRIARYDWRRLGYSRDRVYSIAIQAAVKVALVTAEFDIVNVFPTRGI